MNFIEWVDLEWINGEGAEETAKAVYLNLILSTKDTAQDEKGK